MERRAKERIQTQDSTYAALNTGPHTEVEKGRRENARVTQVHHAKMVERGVPKIAAPSISQTDEPEKVG